MKRVFLPRSIEELWTILDREREGRLYCGGTDLLVQIRAGKTAPDSLICLERIHEIEGIRDHETKGLWIGAATTHARILDDPRVVSRFPVLTKALKTLGSPLIRAMGTIGGNVCTASPAGDTLPPLYLLDGEVELRSRNGNREMPLRNFIAGPGRTNLLPGEILAGLCLKDEGRYNIHHFEKIGKRQAMACAIASLAALLRVSPSGVIEAARLAWGSAGPTVITSKDIEDALIGENLSREVIEKAAALARKAVAPISDVRASAAYRRDVSGNLLLRLLEYRPRA